MKVRRVLGTLVLVMALALGVVGAKAPDASARTTTKSVTLLKGEKYVCSAFIGRITSASTSKKSVISLKKSSTKVTCTAKKAGKATVTVRMTGGTVYRYKFTVKNVKIQISCVSVHYTTGSVNTTSDVALEIINKSGVFIPYAKYKVALYDQAGAELETKEYTVSDLVPGAKIYKVITYYGNPVGGARLVGKVSGSRYNTNKYYNYSKKVKVSSTKSGATLQVRMKNTTKKNVSGSADVVFYGADGSIIYVRPCSFYLKSKESTSTNVSLFSDMENATYKIFTRAYAY